MIFFIKLDLKFECEAHPVQLLLEFGPHSAITLRLTFAVVSKLTSVWQSLLPSAGTKKSPMNAQEQNMTFS